MATRIDWTCILAAAAVLGPGCSSDPERPFSVPDATGGTGASGGSSTGTGGGGASTAQCPAGQTACDNRCVDLATTGAHCGACNNACAAGQICQAEVCSCTGGLEQCLGVCVDISSNPAHCGACSVVCQAGQQCQGGTCVCQGALTQCGGVCVDLQSSPTDCGACGQACPTGQVCSTGVCSDGCAEGLTQCGASCVDLASSLRDCGECGVVCGAGQSCVAGTCTCGAGQAQCDGQCVDTATSAAHCGSCGMACASDQTCQNGVCTCTTDGQQPCGSVCTDVQADAANCGSCGNVCPAGSTCVGGVCTAQGSGGAAGTGGAATGGDAAGGAATGGEASGGQGTGGEATGGEATGGEATGGEATGGEATGGEGTGGEATGGEGTGGEATGGAQSGCPLDLEGFATVSADGQNGTYGGRDGEVVTVTNEDDLDSYATASAPYTIRVQGAITITPKGREIRVASDKTIIGVGTSGEIVEGGFFLAEGVHNVILRNLTIRDTLVEGDWAGDTQDFDAVQMDTAHHVWIDHCHLHHGGDGLIDSRKDTTHLTVSWNILSDHNKTFGIGWTDNVTAQMTIHHNWIRDTNQRNPAVDNVLRAHLYNNFLQRVDSYGNHARGGTNMVLENSVFDQVDDPHYYDSGTLVTNESMNIYRDTTGARESSGSTYSFFDPHDFYSYTLHSADEVESLLQECGGPRAELGQ